MSINIGNSNRIKKSIIAENSKIPEKKENRKWHEKHPIFIAVVAAVISGIVLKFSVWDKMIQIIEHLFGDQL
ncbi:MAG: hypothetical protein K2N01_03060 [Lachnospiraceae bacterium]|nr:hypothetical protein [Lachnospiraceae bacterium]